MSFGLYRDGNFVQKTSRQESDYVNCEITKDFSEGRRTLFDVETPVSNVRFYILRKTWDLSCRKILSIQREIFSQNVNPQTWFYAIKVRDSKLSRGNVVNKIVLIVHILYITFRRSEKGNLRIQKIKSFEGNTEEWIRTGKTNFGTVFKDRRQGLNYKI